MAGKAGADVDVLPPGSFRLENHLRFLDHKIELVLGGVTQEKVDKAGVRDLAVAYGVLVDKKQLLEGKPTQILSVEERRELPALVKLLLQEAERRQISVTVDLNPEVAAMTDAAPEDGGVGVRVEAAPLGGLETKRPRRV